ncbi:hypothetical protein EXS72_01010 [Candidatus Pacearchaeota archaeon]|nr:hypothetical protein [Candidatus Pacearchaeota archaeon]
MLNKNRENLIEGEFGTVILDAESRIEKILEFELPKNALGDYILIIEISEGLAKKEYEQNIRLTSKGISGFAISENNLKTIYWFTIVGVLSFVIYLGIKFIRRQIMLKRVGQIQERRFIAVDLND